MIIPQKKKENDIFQLDINTNEKGRISINKMIKLFFKCNNINKIYDMNIDRVLYSVLILENGDKIRFSDIYLSEYENNIMLKSNFLKAGDQ